MFILFAGFTPYTFSRVRGQEGEYVHAIRTLLLQLPSVCV